MEETRKFLRYVLPGLIIIPEMIFIFYLNGEIDRLEDYFNIGNAIIGLLGSGIIGFLFSNLYYIIYWEFYMRLRRVKRISFVDLINGNEDLFKAFNIIPDEDRNSKNIKKKGWRKKNKYKSVLTEKEAWPIINAFFNLNNNDKPSYVDKKSGSMSNVLVSIGTTILVLACVFLIGICSIKCSDNQAINIIAPFGVIFLKSWGDLAVYIVPFNISLIRCCWHQVVYIVVNMFVLMVLCWNYQLTAGILNNLFKRYLEWIKIHNN